jgi:L-ascorbate metabolism protein UlaG (beta-lactamase superfamily)
MMRDINGKMLMLGPRNKGLAFTTSIRKFYTLSVDETIEVDGMIITGLKATHGPLTLKVGPFSKTVHPGPKERIGWGGIGFEIKLDGKTVVNLGDTLLQEKEWEKIKNPDILMIPIGGKEAHNTMDEKEALQAIKKMRPKFVIPCHYNLPALFTKRYCPADDKMFKKEVENIGAQCIVMHEAESVEI